MCTDNAHSGMRESASPADRRALLPGRAREAGDQLQALRLGPFAGLNAVDPSAPARRPPRAGRVPPPARRALPGPPRSVGAGWPGGGAGNSWRRPPGGDGPEVSGAAQGTARKYHSGR